MKSIQILLLFMVTTLTASAQGVFNNQTNAALQQVIEDYPNRFRNITGERLREHNGFTDYKSKISIPGSVDCVISQVNPPEKICTWTCSLFVSNNYEQALQKYQELFDQIHNTIIRVKGEKPFIITGTFAAPDQENKSASIRFQFHPVPQLAQSLRVELNMIHNENWDVILTVTKQAD
ncbi:hypothetical protein HHL16_04155 [Pseudoflavitalea sp. G-6-1-2]|uniref:hypothetical protein n=1 Tax=Pseudoflavitalea sp. G-6-1-2 TaxID=2728841 RepID=UPI00146ECC26|nr:hypothetical protein [Pseudoflavitalea sp. G-6-1-2]NML20051.1 hypothetical protein [Pseudoflavitalea sp. G-6-1-2]